MSNIFNKITLTIIAWNIYIGTGAKAARTALRDFIERFSPEIIALMEATNLYNDLDGLGYEVIQLRPKPSRKGNRPGQGNIALLVRNDVPILKRKALHMRKFWRGPKHGLPQDPRVYRSILVEFDGRKWKIGCAHTPFGTEARIESRFRLVRWLQKTLPGRPTVLVIDANMHRSEFKNDIAEPGGAKIAGDGIDLTAYKNCKLVNEENLGRGISDHPAMKYDYVAPPKKRRK